MREKYKKYQKNKGFDFDQFKSDFIENMQKCEENSQHLNVDIRSNDYPMLNTNESKLFCSDNGSTLRKKTISTPRAKSPRQNQK